MRWLSRFTWDSGAEVLDLSLPPALWRESRRPIGGSGRSAAGVLAGYRVRTDFLISVPFRIVAAEWVALLGMIAWAETGGELVWYPDREDLGLSFTVSLEQPTAQDEFAPEPDGSYQRVRLATLVLRNQADQAFALDYFEEP